MPNLCLEPFYLSEPTRNQKDKCELCSQSFGITTREHLCKRCFRFVCDKCAPHKMRIYKADMQHRLHRMCIQCYTQSQILRKYTESNKLVWGQDSDMSRLWLKQLGRQGNNRASLNNSKNTKQNGKGRVVFDVTPGQVWSSLNYSFRELIGISIDRNKQLQQYIQENNKKQKSKNLSLQLHKTIVQELLQLLANIVNSMSNLTIQPESILYILMFFMAHASPTNAVTFTKSIIQFLSFQEMTPQNIAYYFQKLQCNDNQIYKMENYIQCAISKIASTATINYFSAEVSIEIVSSIISKKSSDELQRGIAYTLSKRKQFIMKNANKPDLIIIDLLRSNQGLGDAYKKFAKLCQNQDNQDNNGTSRNLSKRNSDSTKSIIRTQQFYNNLIKQNEELKIKNKNQQEQIMRLKIENNKLIINQKRRKSQLSGDNGKYEIVKQYSNQNSMDIAEIDDLDSQNSYESYWEEVKQNNAENGENQHQGQVQKQRRIKKAIQQQLPFEFKQQKNYDQVINQFKQVIKSKSKVKESQQKKYKWEFRNGINVKFVKKYKLKSGNKKIKRMTTMSQKLVKQINNLNNNNDKKQKKDAKAKYDDMLQSKNQQISKLVKQIKMLKKSNQPNLSNQNKQLKNELVKLRQMNKGLLQKMSQLSKMLMDKEQEQVNEERESLHEIMELYEAQKLKGEEQNCNIF